MPEPKKKCPVCSELLNIDAIRCSRCGATFGERPGSSGTEMAIPTSGAPEQTSPKPEPAPSEATQVALPWDETVITPRFSTGTLVASPGDETTTAPKSSTETVVARPPPGRGQPPTSQRPPSASTATVLSTPGVYQELHRQSYQAAESGGKPPHPPAARPSTLQVDEMPVAGGKPKSALGWTIAVAAIVGLCLCVLGVAAYTKREAIAGLFVPKPAATLTPEPTRPLTASVQTSPTAQEPTQTAASTKELLLWVTKSSDATIRLAREFEVVNPGVKIDVREVPADGVVNRWETEIRGKNGPDMLLFSNGSLFQMVESGSVMQLDALIGEQSSGVSPVAWEGVKVNGHIYGVPRSFNVMALYVNTSLVSQPPKTTQELLDLVKQGQRIIILQQPNVLYGFFTAFGGALADSEGRCIADQVGFADAMQYLLDLKQAGAIFEQDHSRATETFRLGGASLIVYDPSKLEEFSLALPNSLEVVPIPSHLLPGAPLSQVDAFYINPYSAIPQAAVDLANFMTSFSSEETWEVEYYIPVRTDVKRASLAMDGFMTAAVYAVPMPQAGWFFNFWSPFTKMVNDVLDGKYPPIEAVQRACAEMNQANGK